MLVKSGWRYQRFYLTLRDLHASPAAAFMPQGCFGGISLYGVSLGTLQEILFVVVDLSILAPF